MHYVKQFDINGVGTKQVACIELHGKPNAAIEGAVGVLGVDVDSPTHDVYKCVAVNGSIYTWELLSSGLSIMSGTISGGGAKSVEFPYTNLKTPPMYVIKVGDLVLDPEGYLYQIDALNATYCFATYTGTQIALYGKSAYDLAVKDGFEGSEEEWLASLKGEQGIQGVQGEPGNDGEDGEDGLTPYIGDNNNWWIGGIDTGVLAAAKDGAQIATGTYTPVQYYDNAVSKFKIEQTLTFDFVPKIMFAFHMEQGQTSSYLMGSFGIFDLVNCKAFGISGDSIQLNASTTPRMNYSKYITVTGTTLFWCDYDAYNYQSCRVCLGNGQEYRYYAFG